MASLDLAGIITRVCTDLKTRFAALSHTHAMADVVDLQSTLNGKAASSHSHGYITNIGAITSDTAAASGDKLVISDSSDSSRLKRSGIAFGSDTTTFLRNDGQWAAAGGVSMSTATASLTTSGWSNNQKTVSVSGVTASNSVIVSPAPASMTAWAAAGVYCSAQGAGTLTFTCSTVPTSALTANVLILS